MCDPATIIAISSLAVAVGGTAAGVIGQAQQAQAQSNYQKEMVDASNRQMAENQKLALANYEQGVASNQFRDQQEVAAESQAVQANSIKSAEAQAQARVAAGEAGVSGLSVDTLLADFQRQEAVFNDSSRHNLDMTLAQSEDERKAMKTQAEGNIASVQPYIAQPVTQPDYLGSALRIAGSATDWYYNNTEYNKTSRNRDWAFGNPTAYRKSG